MKKRLNRGIKLLSLSLAVILCIGTVLPVSAASVSEAQKKAAELEAEKKAAEAQKSGLAAQLNGIIAEMQAAQEKLAAKEAEIEIAETELVNAKIEENNQYESMKKRIKYMYENGNIEFIEILLSAESITDFLNKAEYVTKISEYDREMLVEFQKLVQQVADKEAKLKAEYEELNVLQKELTAKQGQVEALLSEKSLEISNLQAEIGANAAVLQKLIEAAQEAERKRQEEIAYQQQVANQQQLANQQQSNAGNSGSGNIYTPGSPSVSGNGQFTHPCPNSTISSPFGERWGTNHNGLDLAASEGTPIYAADSGTVVIAGWSNSAGNWVVINHGNGLTTKYMHMVSAPYVSTGQSVSRGQNIGAVGNTGNSFGNHLHFQVEVGNTPVDPQGYL